MKDNKQLPVRVKWSNSREGNLNGDALIIADGKHRVRAGYCQVGTKIKCDLMEGEITENLNCPKVDYLQAMKNEALAIEEEKVRAALERVVAQPVKQYSESRRQEERERQRQKFQHRR